jgi:hypothetical protein
VLVVERWILARLRNRKFFSLMELNHAIALLLNDLNARAFKKLPGNRRSAFEQLDLPALAPLPAKRFELFRWKSAKITALRSRGLRCAITSASRRSNRHL